MPQTTQTPPNSLSPDGITIIVPWKRLYVGDSVFIPCLNADLCAKQVRDVGALYGWQFQTRRRIEHNLLGLRIWRTA